jgi:cell shape-determining protein MreC
MTSNNRFGRVVAWRSTIAWLALAAGLALIPAPQVERARLVHRRGLEYLRLPLRVAAALLERDAPTPATDSSASDQSAAENERLRRRVSELERALAAASTSLSVSVSEENRLLRAELLSARVLGPRARNLAAAETIVEISPVQSITRDALVLDTASLITIDQGNNAAVRTGQIALAGRNIWGKVIDVGAQTAVVRRPTHVGFRDLVQLAHRDGDRLVVGPRGLLEGDGNPRAQVRLIEVGHAVSVGDEVLAAGWEGLIDVPLCYGKIVRVERAAEARYWKLWMEPTAVDTAVVDIVRAEPNRARLARQSKLVEPPQGITP